MVVRSPQPATVRLDNRSADAQAHTGSMFFSCKESVEDLAGLVGWQAYARVCDGYQQLLLDVVLGTEGELTRAVDGLHGVDAVDHQVHQYLLELDPVGFNKRVIGCEIGLYQNRMLASLVAQQNLHLPNQLIDIDALLGHRALSEEQPDAVNDLRRAVGIANDQGRPGARALDIRWLAIEPAHAGRSVRNRAADRLIDLVRQGGAEFTHSGYPIRVRQVSLRFAQCIFGALAVLDIDAGAVPLDDFSLSIA